MAKRRAVRNKQTLELEPPWHGIREQWASIPPDELKRRHEAAERLRTQGYGAVRLMGEGTQGEIFSDDF